MNNSREPTRPRLTNAIKQSLREMNAELAVLNHRVSASVELRDVDRACLDLISRTGATSPSALAQRMGLHPATTTGILDRLEAGGWITRQRDPNDRRAVLVELDRTRLNDLVERYTGMNAALDEICARYDPGQLEAIADFLARSAEAGQRAAEQITAAGQAGQSPTS